MKDNINEILSRYWGYPHFRPLQEEIIRSVLENRDTLALLPTGGGKSICFQVPAMARKGLCLVISPLIALMKDQVESLKKKRIKATAIYSGMSKHDIELIVNNCVFDKSYKFLYVSPERLQTDLFRANFEKMNISMIAVDEAHCISQWGYDFRPPYLEIAEVRTRLPGVPVLALTATATPEVVEDIQEKLKFKKKNVFQKSFKRENLTYYVVKEEDKRGRMLRIIRKYPGTGVIYVRNRRRTREIAEFLNQYGISADYYHAGLDPGTRDRKQNEWMQNKIRIIVSTNAFGMGIDKPDVRFVIHLDIPDTLEAYFQEAGRGGRDEKPAIAVMLYDDHDLKNLEDNFERSFPPLSTIKKIYSDLGNYCRVAIGSGENCSYPFDPDEFAKTYKIQTVEFYSAVKFLEKTGVILFSEEFHSPSTLFIKMNREEFHGLQKNNPVLHELMQLLLRSYSGLFTNTVKINEAEIARRAGINEKDVTRHLTTLKKLNAVDYHPKSAKPHLFFLQDRIHEKDLYFEESVYKQRKKVAKKRLDAVIHFITCSSSCRSRLLLAYFGEANSSRCEKCDICLKTTKSELSKQEFDQIAEAVRSILQEQKQQMKELLSALSKDHAEEKIVQTVRWLIDHNAVKLSEDNSLQWNKR